MSAWVCRCGKDGAAVSEDRAAADWLIHARRKGCSSISRQELVDAMRGQLMLAAAPGGEA